MATKINPSKLYACISQLKNKVIRREFMIPGHHILSLENLPAGRLFTNHIAMDVISSKLLKELYEK